MDPDESVRFSLAIKATNNSSLPRKWFGIVHRLLRLAYFAGRNDQLDRNREAAELLGLAVREDD